MPPQPANPTFFATPTDFRAWLDEHHRSGEELWVGFHKKGTGTPSITWPEAVDEALCVGWIDGVRKSLDAHRYVIRFTPRKARSNWSAVNIARMAVLESEGRLHPAGRAAFERRLPEKSGIYAYEQRGMAELDEESLRLFQAEPAAWEFFQSRPAGYRRTCIWWVVTAKREETRRKRLATLIADSAAGRTLARLTRPGTRNGTSG
jgi:uncharacterized protein YdeI (YjbR/CyaY-like superfamily)